MIAAVLHARKDPARLFCIAVVLSLAAFLAFHLGMLYARQDFAAADLGASDVSDFFLFYSSARFLLDGGSIAALYDPLALKAYQVALGASTQGLHPFNYPPTYALLIEPLGLLPYPVALICWHWGTLAVFAYSLRLAGLSGFEILAAVVAPASILNISAGQNGFVTSAFLISGMALLARRPLAAGSLFGLLTLKPHLGLLVPIACLAGRRWTVIAAAAIATAGLVAVSLLAAGLEAWSAYFDFLKWFRAEAEAQAGGPFLALTSTPYMAARIAGLPKFLAYPLQAAVTIYVGVALYQAFRRCDDSDLRLALILVGASLATPYGNLYDLPFVGAAIILLTRRGLRGGFRPYEGLCLLVAYLLPVLGGPLNQAGIPIVPAVHFGLFLYIQARLRAGVHTQPEVAMRQT